MDRAWLTEQFEIQRQHLQGVAYRLLGSRSEAEDAVQESWIRLNRADTGTVENLAGWLTTVVARISLDMLRSRSSRREEPLARETNDLAANNDPAQEAVIADSVGLAMLVVLETLSPAERVAFVLHDMFGVPFDEIAPIVGRTEAAARKLASRARGRLQGGVTVSDAGQRRQREIVEAFLAASRGGDFEALLVLLDPDVVLRADDSAVQMGAAREERGASAVAASFAGRARAARVVIVDGSAVLVWAQGGRPRVFFNIKVSGDRIQEIELIADPDRLASLEIGKR
ncbi:MAG: sigma-70 family RNA polymerase sigma factor [Acidimicrobiia bacterium]